MHFFGTISVKEGVVINPKCTLSIDLPKVIEIKLTDQTLEAGMAKVLRKRFRLKAREIGNPKCLSRWYPLCCADVIFQRTIIGTSKACKEENPKHQMG